MEPDNKVVIASAEIMNALEDFAGLARVRNELVGLYRVLPTPSLTARVSAADHVLVRQYERLLSRGQGLEAASILALYHARHIRMAAERRAA